MNDETSPSASRLLRDATDDLTIDTDRIVQHGIARGRTLQRRRRVGTAFAAAAVVGVIGVAASVGPGLVAGDEGSDGPDATGATAAPRPSTPPTPKGPLTIAPTEAPATPDAELSVAARDVPAAFVGLLGGEVGEIREEAPYGVVDQAQRKVVHFTYDGTLTTFAIERADTLASCAEMADSADRPAGTAGTCEVDDGIEVLVSGPTTADNVTAQGVSAWQHGYVVSALSYNALEGKDVAPVSDVPAIAIRDLVDLVTSDVWFVGSDGGPDPEPPAPPTGPDVSLLVDGRAIPDLVTAVAPGEVTSSSVVPRYVDTDGVANASFRLDGMFVNAGVSLTDGRDPMQDCRSDYPSDSAISPCTAQPDGTVVAGTDGQGTDGGQSLRRMFRYGPGYVIFVEAYNTADGRGGPLVAPDPPLSMDQLTTIVESDRWLE